MKELRSGALGDWLWKLGTFAAFPFVDNQDLTRSCGEIDRSAQASIYDKKRTEFCTSRNVAPFRLL